MRILVLLVGLTGVVGAASAGDLNLPFNDTGAAMGRVMFEARFGGEQPAFAQQSFQLQFGSEHQFNTGLVPLRTEYRPATGSVLVNGIDLKPLLANHLGEEGGLGASLVGWIPVAVVATAVGLVVVDGRNNSTGITTGTGGS